MHRALAVSAVLGAWACTNPTVAFDDLDATALRSRCERFVRCGAVADQETCEGFFRKRVDHDLAAAVAAGKVRYDGELARVCYDTLAAMTCDDTAREARVPPQSCARIFSGTLDAGESCEFDRECSSNTCAPDAPPCNIGECCPGTCVEVTLAELDAPCKITKDCVADAYCHSQTLVCVSLGVEDDQCYVDAQCDYGLVCDTATNPGSCVAVGLRGEPCPDDRCAEVGTRCDASNMCVDAGLPGDPCVAMTDCSMFGQCDPTNTCAVTPTVGASCTTFCTGEAWCDRGGGSSGTCRAPIANGEPCMAANECASLHCAEGAVFDFCEEAAVCF